MIRLAVIALICFTSAQSKPQGRSFDIFDEIPLPRQNFAIQQQARVPSGRVHIPFQPAGVPARKVHIQTQPQPRQPAVVPGSQPALALTAHFDQLLLDAERQEEQVSRAQVIQQRQQDQLLEQQEIERERKIEKLEALRDLYLEFPELAPSNLPVGTPVAAAPQSVAAPPQPKPVVVKKPVRIAPKPVARPPPRFQQTRTRSQFKPQSRPQTRPRFSSPAVSAPKPAPRPTRPQPINVAEILQPAQVQPQPPRPAVQPPRPALPKPIEVQKIIKPAPGKLFERPEPAPEAARPAPRPAPVKPAPVRQEPARPTPVRLAPARQAPARQQQARPLPTFQQRQQGRVEEGRPIVQQQRVFGKQHTTLTGFSDVGIQPEPVGPIGELGPTPRPFVDILKTFQRKNADGTFTFGYTGEDGSFKEETRGNDCVVRGKYGYIDPEGMRREYTYVTGNPCDPNAPKVANPEDPESLVPGGYYDYERDVYVTPEGQEVQLSLKRKGGHRRRFQ